MNTITTEQIETLVREYLINAAMFTAYNITCALRSQNLYAPHETVRQIVHRMYFCGQMGWYTRTLCDLGGANGPAFVYHHCEDNPCDYHELKHLPLKFTVWS